MKSFPSLLAALACLAPTLAAQNLSVVFPKKYQAGADQRTQTPFAMQPVRYQQVFFKKELQELIKNPVRMRGIRFRAKETGNPGYTVDLQLAIGSIKGFASSTFDRNLGNAVIVFPRSTITLPTSTAGQFVVNLPFNQNFTWDYESDLVIDIRIYKNGNQSRPFLYWFDQFLDFLPTYGSERMWALGPNATTASNRFRGQGLVVQFDYQEGTAITYGQGCKGLGGHVPEINAGGIPVVGNTSLRMNLGRAKPQVPAILLLWGGSRTKWGPFTLPLDLKPVGIPGCVLLTEPLQIFPTVTQGGSPGTGIASVPFGIPPVNLFKGISIFAQWAVLDDSQAARIIPLSFSNGVWLSIG